MHFIFIRTGNEVKLPKLLLALAKKIVDTLAAGTFEAVWI
jgi:hypothetical protein